MNRPFAAFTAIALLVGASAVHATTAEEWALCNSCTTQTQFENAAIAWVGNRIGTYEVEVGNINTSKVYRVSVTTTTYPSNPAGHTPDVFEAPSGHQVLMLTADPPPAAVTGDVSPSAYATVNHAIQESQAVQDQFAAVVLMFGKQPMIAPGPKQFGFESFAFRENAAVCRVAGAAMTSAHPGWQAGQISPPSLGKLFTLLRYHYGRGPRVHVIFNNGDVASFQLHPMIETSCQYVDGTAKDRDGADINEPGGVSNSGSPGVTVVSHPGTGRVQYGMGSGSYWMVCAFRGEVLWECYVEWVPA